MLPIACLADNYAYLVMSPGARVGVIVDPSESAPVEAALRGHDVELVAILATHHHHDHVGGNLGLRAARPGLSVYAHESDQPLGRVPGQTHGVADGESFTIAGLTVRALHVPGHTLGALAYVVGDAVFTGDTLFLAGCGRLFEGTPDMMSASLARIAALAPSTRVYPGHEYTLDNLRFGAHVEPENRAIAARYATVAEHRARALPTVPGHLAEELATNPFLRTREASLLARYETKDPVVAFTKLRAEKDRF